MQVFGFHVYNLYSFPRILNGNVNKCYELVSSDLFCLFPLWCDSFLICKMWRFDEMILFILCFFVSVVRMPSTFIFQGMELKAVSAVCAVCKIVFTHIGWCHSLLTVLLYSCPPIKLMLLLSRFILELKD